MSNAVASSTGIVAYFALFGLVAVLFLFAALVIGRFLRPRHPSEEKLNTYECGEPSEGSSYVQFDLRFYVVALVFLIFDVEVAFFFPWAALFGKASHLSDPSARNEVVVCREEGLHLTQPVERTYLELGIRDPQVPTQVPPSLVGKVAATAEPQQRAAAIVKSGAKQLMWVAVVDMAVFFVVLLVGFAYVWHRGDLDWVRAYGSGEATVQPAVGGRVS